MRACFSDSLSCDQ
ncbi:hypothetical protein D030_0477A, partial [Vibrio parahaemolyticus AQ3810]